MSVHASLLFVLAAVPTPVSNTASNTASTTAPIPAPITVPMPGPTSEPTDIRAAEDEALAELWAALLQHRAGTLDAARLVEAVRANVGGCRTDVLDALVTGRLPQPGSTPEADLRPEERAILLAHLDAPSAALLFQDLEAWVDWPRCTPERLVALEVVGAHGDAGQAGLAFDLVTWSEPPTGALGRRLRDGFEEALATVLARDDAAFDRLSVHWGRLPDEMLIPGARALGRSGSPRAAQPLLELIRSEERALGAAIAELGRLAPHVEGDLRREVAANLVAFAAHEHAGVRAAVARALGALGGRSELLALAQLLDDDAPAVVSSAHRALIARTGLAFRADGRRWSGYLREESAWYEEAAPALLESLGGDDDARTLDALRRLSQHPLYREELTPAFADLLDHPTEGIRLAACRVLSQGPPEPDVLDRLAAAMRHDGEPVARAAHHALATLTTAELPFDPDSWDAYLTARARAR